MTQVRRVTGDEDSVIFHVEDGRKFRLHHWQDCTENVYLKDIAGDLQDLVGSPILLAKESTNGLETDQGGFESQQWTFYRFATAKGYVTLSWEGSSNGFYSMSVDFDEITDTP
jgi:hypothetical protein